MFETEDIGLLEVAHMPILQLHLTRRRLVKLLASRTIFFRLVTRQQGLSRDRSRLNLGHHSAPQIVRSTP